MHLDAVENSAPFAAVVLIAIATGVSNAPTESCAAITVAWVAFVVFAGAVLQRAI